MNDHEKEEFKKAIKKLTLVRQEEVDLEWDETRHQNLEKSSTCWQEFEADKILQEMIKKRDLDFSRASVERSRASLVIARYCAKKLEE